MNRNAIIIILALAIISVGAIVWLGAREEARLPVNGDNEISQPTEVRVSENNKSLVFVDERGEVVYEYTIDDWQSWARNNFLDVYDEPITIGDQEMTAERFDLFGTEAVMSPDRSVAFFSVHTYAILTTISLAGIINVEDREIKMIPQNNNGDVGEIAWSPDNRYVAYTLGTARAMGDFLTVDNVSTAEKSFVLAENAILNLLREEGSDLELLENQDILMPNFRDLEWLNNRRIEFTSDTHSDDTRQTARFSISADGTALQLVE
jgi:hypothetical protein